MGKRLDTSSAYTESFFRPLARRRLMIARPPLVFIRCRKPCDFARLFRFG
jgi:hypothetical protein